MRSGLRGSESDPEARLHWSLLFYCPTAEPHDCPGPLILLSWFHSTQMGKQNLSKASFSTLSRTSENCQGPLICILCLKRKKVTKRILGARAPREDGTVNFPPVPGEPSSPPKCTYSPSAPGRFHVEELGL